MGFFSRLNKKRSSTINSPSSTSSTVIPSPASPALSQIASSSTSPALPSIKLRVAIDGDAARDLFYINVNPDDGPGAVRREIAQIIGHSCMTLFKVSIPWQAHVQACAYSERYGKQVDLLATFAAFNLDDPAQLQTSLPPAWKEMAAAAVETGSVTLKDWFPTHSSTDSEIISVLARPAPDACLLNSVPLTLRAYFATPTHTDQSPYGNSRAQSASPPRPTPIVIDITPYITVDELKATLLRASGRDDSDWRRVTLWQIAMTDSEMTVIDELGRLKGGKMPWPYPPGAMEPIPMSDGNLPVCLFFPRSAPFGDMLDLSVWIDHAVNSGIRSTFASGTASDTPPFRYPMASLPPSKRPASIAEASGVPSLDITYIPVSAPSSPALVAQVPLPITLQSVKTGSRLRNRPSTAPAAVSESVIPTRKSAPAFESRSAHPLRSVQTNMLPPQSSRPSTAVGTSRPSGLGIITEPTKVGRASFASTASFSEDEGAPPSLNFSDVSLERADLAPPLRTPDVEGGLEWLSSPGSGSEPAVNAADAGVGGNIKKGGSLHLRGGSLSMRIRRARVAV